MPHLPLMPRSSDNQGYKDVGLVGDEAHQRFGLVGVEAIYDEVPAVDHRSSFHTALNMLDEVFFGACGAARNRGDSTGDDIEVDDQRQGAMPDVFELAPFDFARRHGQPRVFPLQGLNAGHFVRAHHRFALLRQLRRLSVERVDVVDFLIELLIRLGCQPITNQVRLDTLFFSKRAA